MKELIRMIDFQVDSISEEKEKWAYLDLTRLHFQVEVQ